MTDDDVAAMPGDPGLDCHLLALQLTSLRLGRGDGFDQCGVLDFSAADAGGWVADEHGRRCHPDGQGFTLRYALHVPLSYAHYADDMTVTLERWLDEGTYLSVCAAPGRWTRIADGDGHEVLLPRSSTGAEAALP